jgi:hypothetical protein
MFDFLDYCLNASPVLSISPLSFIFLEDLYDINLTEIGVSPGSSLGEHIYTQTIHRIERVELT